jgi:hypothetical protein
VNADALEGALRALGIDCTVELHDRVAVVRSTVQGVFADDRIREHALALAREHGFSHVAVDVTGAEERAPLPRD